MERSGIVSIFENYYLILYVYPPYQGFIFAEIGVANCILIFFQIFLEISKKIRIYDAY